MQTRCPKCSTVVKSADPNQWEIINGACPELSGTQWSNKPENELKGKSTSIVMVAFDLLYLNGYDLRKLPLEERKSHLKKLIAKTAIQFSESFEVDGPEMYQHACSVGLEGVVSKVRDSHPAGRGNDWVKKTCAQRETLPIAGFALKADKFDGIYRGRRKGNDVVYAGKVDHGFDRTSTAELQARLKPLIRKTQPYAKKGRASRRLGRTVAQGRDRIPRQIGRGKIAASVLQGNSRGPVMKLTHRFAQLTPDKRPQDPNMDGAGLRFETLEHGGEYPDTMPQAIKLADAEGSLLHLRSDHARRQSGRQPRVHSRPGG
jgi:hypothetical protein